MGSRSGPGSGGLLAALTSWWVLLPLMAGLSAGAVAWALDQDQVAVVPCVLGGLMALGAALTRIIVRPPSGRAWPPPELTDCLDALEAGQGRCQETPRTATPAPAES
ncbi:MAG TPA: hypothetical protein VJ739_04750 [Gemmataceae bacterium]|nr:hypothetical protein [Gemmataceae bacterium]